MAAKKITKNVNKKILTHQKYITVVSKFDILERFVFPDLDILYWVWSYFWLNSFISLDLLERFKLSFL